MEVILLEKIRRLGNLGDKVSVKSGYGANYLVPQGKAVYATAENLEQFEKRRAELEENARKELARAEQRAAKINDTNVTISAMASDEGKLYGFVGVNEIQKALQEKEITVDKKEIELPDGSFHSTGQYTVDICLHTDVVAQLHIDISSEK